MPGGRLGPQRPALAVLLARLEQEQLLLDDVGDLADPPLVDGRLLEQRRLDRVVAVAGGELRGDPLQARQPDPVGRQQVARASGGAEGGHR